MRNIMVRVPTELPPGGRTPMACSKSPLEAAPGCQKGWASEPTQTQVLGSCLNEVFCLAFLKGQKNQVPTISLPLSKVNPGHVMKGVPDSLVA